MTTKREVKVVDYDPAWPTMFLTEAERLQYAYGENAVAIEHVGSTAVPGLKAKPIIDILIGADSLAVVDAHIRDIEVLGYEYIPKFETIFPERRFFQNRNAHGEGFHIHAVVKGSDFWQQHIRFRDILRHDKAAAEKYATLKTELAKKYRYDIESYVQGKTDLITQLLN